MKKRNYSKKPMTEKECLNALQEQPHNIVPLQLKMKGTFLYGPNGEYVGRCQKWEYAAFIVSAFNAHDRLVLLLSQCLPIVDQYPGADRLGIAIADELKAIAKAEEK